MDILLLPGKWDAVSCTSSQRYVCELTDLCPNDPNKIDPGICGCGIADIDSDGDGAKDCVDGCPSDAHKTAVGQCGCGNPDIDSDADGTADCLDACNGAPETDTDHDGLADCVDQCPGDPNRAEPGNCGCIGNPGPAAAGTPCFDGLCQASSQCDGAGSCGNANECVPAGTSCTPQVRNGHLYLFCNNASSWSAAQATCRMQPDMDLVRIDDAEENEFVHSHLTANAWLGSSDAATPSEWSWSIPTPSKGRTFWSGDAVSGTGLGYTNWAANRPSAGECLSMNAGAGDWSDASCATAQSFVCEVFRPVGLLLPSTLSNRLNRISDPTERSHFAFGLFAAQRAMCNYAAGVTSGETEQWISSYLAEKLGPSDVTAAKASIVSMCNNLLPAALRKTYLGPLASADPLDNTIYLAGESIDACDSATALTEQPARLRANYCSHGVSADPRALSVATTLAEQAFGPDNTLPYFQRHRVSGAPVLIGLDEVAGFPQTEPITIDRTNNRAPAGPPGDGYNMLGVRTNIPCTTGSCDPNLGQLCSSEVPGWLPVEEPDPNCTSSNPCSPLLVNHCIAYPIVQFQDDMKLIGYNFWDTCSAQLLMTERDTQTQHLLPLKGRIATAGEPVNNDELACTPSPDGLRLAAAGIASSTEATFTTQNQSLPRGKFYTLQMFNKNGTMSTQHDVQERQLVNANINDAPPRAIHVCWDCNPNISDTDCPRDCADANDTHCVLGRCGTIDQTCESDACDGSQVSECDPTSGPRDGTCSANLWNATPRDLSNPLCQHNPGEPPRCAETPFWVGSDPHPEKGHPIIFLAESAPDYRVTLKLKRVKAKQETGWDCFVCNDDDVRAHFSTVRFDDGGRMQFETKDYDAEFDEGQSRDEDAVVSQIRVGRSATVHWELLYTEHDNFLVQSVLLSAALSALGNYVAGYYGAAIGGAIGSLTVAWSDFVEGPDVMGADAWEASIARLNQAYGDSRTGDLLAHATLREPIASLPHADPARVSRKWTNACDHLMHPFDRSYLDVVTPNYDITASNGRGAGVALDCLHYGDAVRQCGPDFMGTAACPADHCFAGRCTSSVVGSNGCHPSDTFCGLNNGVKGFFERRDIASDDSAGEARYIWDFLYTFETCDGRVSPGTPQVCQPLP